MRPGISAASNSLFSKLKLFCSDCETLYHKHSLSVAGILEPATLHELAVTASAHSAPRIFSAPSPGRRLRPHHLHGLHTSSLTRAHENQRRWMKAQPSVPSWGRAPLSTQANPPAWCPPAWPPRKIRPGRTLQETLSEATGQSRGHWVCQWRQSRGETTVQQKPWTFRGSGPNSHPAKPPQF